LTGINDRLTHVEAMKMNKAQLIEKMAGDADISKSTAGAALQSLIGAISKALKKNGRISLSGFGTFTKTRRKARKGRNPSTGEAIKIKASTSVRFKSSKGLKEAL
jgi:DNA-binding protein HU-beta